MEGDEDLKAELTCPICMDLFREPRRLPCGHVYCRVCLQDMLTRKYLNTRASERILSCPECRQRYDLTFQEAGVDVFTRDFKLFRLVELFEKKFSRRRRSPEEGDGSESAGGGGAGADDQTAVKSVQRESSPPQAGAPEPSSTAEPSATSSSTWSSLSSSIQPSPLSSQSQEQPAPAGRSGHSPAPSFSDHSWVYVTPDTAPTDDPRPLRAGGRTAALTPALAASRHPLHHPPPFHPPYLHQRGDDDDDDEDWLMPPGRVEGGCSASFPAERGQDVRGNAAAATTTSTDVTYRTLPGGEIEPVIAVSGRYDNVGAPETFQRFAVVDEPTVQLVRLPGPPPPPPPPRHAAVASPSDDSSSESDSSDERGDEGSRSGSDTTGSHGRNRRSRLSRFFRSLVMSDSDSYDEEDDRVYPNGVERHTAFHQNCSGRHPTQSVMASAATNTTTNTSHPVGEEVEGGEILPVAGSVSNPSFAENGPVSASRTRQSSENVPRSDATGRTAGEGERSENADSNHNSVGEGGRSTGSQRNTGNVRADIAGACGGAVGGVGRAVGRSPPGAAVEVSDDSDEEYEPQTSMLRPKRKPRSRLKKFFTSLLSLSSSDDEDEEEGGGDGGQGGPRPPHHHHPPSSAAAPSNSDRQ